MAITPVGSLAFAHNSGLGGAASVDVPTGADTDLEVALGGSNFFDVATGFGPPSGGGWTARFTVDRGDGDAHVRVWTRSAPAGAHTVTLDTIGGEEVWLGIRRLAGTDLANPVDDVDGATSETGSHTAPALSLATEAWLLGAAQSATFEGGGTYTPPSGFTELQDFDVAGGAMHGAVAEDQAAGPGAAGPFVFAYSQADPGAALVIGVRAASTGITGTLAQTEQADTLAASGTSAPPPVTGSLAETEQVDSLTAAGTHTPPGFTGALSVTEAADTLAAAGTSNAPGVAGALVVTEADDTLSASGTFTLAGIVGTVSVTEQPDILAAAGTHTPPPVTGSLAETEQLDTLAASGIFTPEGISGSLAATEAADTLSATGTATPPSFTGTLTVTEATDVLAADGTVVIEGIAGNLAVTEADDTLAAVGTYLLATRPGISTLVVPLISSAAAWSGSVPTAVAAQPAVATSGGVT